MSIARRNKLIHAPEALSVILARKVTQLSQGEEKMDLAAIILAIALAAASGGAAPDSTSTEASSVDTGAPSQPASEAPPEEPDCRANIIDVG